MPFTFLSDEWLAEAKSLLESSGSSGMMPAAVSLNLVVTGGPQGDREQPGTERTVRGVQLAVALRATGDDEVERHGRGHHPAAAGRLEQ